MRQGEKIIKQGDASPHSIIAESDFYIPLNYAKQGEPTLAAGEYQLKGQLIWGENNQNKQDFNVKLTIPSSAN